MQASQIGVLVNFVRSATASPGEFVALSSGANTVSVPAGHDLILICPRYPNPGETVPTFTLQGDPADVGVELHGFFPSMFCLATEGADVEITASAAWDVEIVYGKTETGPVT